MPSEKNFHRDAQSGEYLSHTLIPPALTIMAAWAWRLLAVAAAAALIGWIMLKFSLLLIALLVALLLAVVSAPINNALRNKAHWPPAAAAGVTLLAILLILGAILGGSGTGIYQGFTALGTNVEHGINTVIAWAIQTFPDMQSYIDTAWNDVQKILKNNSEQIIGGVLNASSSITSFFAGFILTFFALFFFLKDGRGI